MSGQFSISNGQIIDPNGNVFYARGINLYDSQMGDASQVLAAFPNVNFIRLNVYSYQSPSAYASFIQTMTSRGIVVELEDHTNSNGSNAGGGQGSAFTGQQLTNELNWYASVASAYKSNPYVWFGTDNEPPPEGLSTWEQQTYNAIRNTGNNNPILLEEPGGGVPSLVGAGNGLDSSVYATMKNVIWDPHYYGWVSNFSTDQQAVNNALTSLAQSAQTIKSADGTVPVIVGEYGPSTNGQTTDANGQQVLQAVQQSTAISGAVAWGFDSGANDNLTDGSGNLTSFGQEVANSMASEASRNPTPSPTPTPKPTPSADDTVVTAGSTAAITDASGNTWTIASGTVQENGQAAGFSANVTEIAYVNGNVWQENNAGLVVGVERHHVAWRRDRHQPAAGGRADTYPGSDPDAYPSTYPDSDPNTGADAYPNRHSREGRFDRRDHGRQRQQVDDRQRCRRQKTGRRPASPPTSPRSPTSTATSGRRTTPTCGGNGTGRVGLAMAPRPAHCRPRRRPRRPPRRPLPRRRRRCPLRPALR